MFPPLQKLPSGGFAGGKRPMCCLGLRTGRGFRVAVRSRLIHMTSRIKSGCRWERDKGALDDMIENLLLRCSETDFGTVPLSTGERGFRNEMNAEILLLCKSLPPSSQTPALLTLLTHLNASLAQGTNFFGYYHPPAWSIIYWLGTSRSGKRPFDKTVMGHAKTGHAMALLLHALDDHLNDGDIVPTHLMLLIRSQAWMIMNRAFTGMADRVEGGAGIVRDLVDDYYAGVLCETGPPHLRGYCDRFKDQMGMGLVAPLLVLKLLKSSEEFAVDVKHAYQLFGVAWRLMDDIRDLWADMAGDIHSGIYFCLPASLKRQWDEAQRGESLDIHKRAVLTYIGEHAILDRILSEVRHMLHAAAMRFQKHRLEGLARECIDLSRPLETTQ